MLLLPVESWDGGTQTMVEETMERYAAIVGFLSFDKLILSLCTTWVLRRIPFAESQLVPVTVQEDKHAVEAAHAAATAAT